MPKVLTQGTAKPRLPKVDLRSLGIVSFGEGNDYPQRIKETVDRSPTGGACTKMKADYIYGRGFAQENIQKLVIGNKNGRDITLGRLFQVMAEDDSYHAGAAYYVRRDGNLNIIALERVPFAFCRFTIPDEKTGRIKIAVHPDWACTSGRSFRKSDILYFDVYSADRAVTLDQVATSGGFDKWNGQIYYHTDIGENDYVKAPSDIVFEDIETDYLMKLNAWRQAKKGFNPSGIFIRRGMPVVDENDPDRADKLRALDNDRESFMYNINENQGIEKSNGVLVVDSQDKELDPVWMPFEVKDRAAEFQNTANMVRERIIGAFKQPLIFHAVRIPSGMSDEEALWNAAKIHYAEVTAAERTALALSLIQPLQEMFPSMGINEQSLEVLPIIDPNIDIKTNDKPQPEQPVK